MRILIVDDEPLVIAPLKKALEREGHYVDAETRPHEGLKRALRNDYDAIMIDLVMPEIDGVEVCRDLRRRACWTPVLLMTGLRDTIGDRVVALDSGADDFLGKPFDLQEALARLRALARRSANERPTILRVDDLTLDPATRTVKRGDTNIALSTREFSLLEYMMRKSGNVLSRHVLLSGVWGYDYLGASNVVDVYIRYLRRKIDEPFGTQSIESIRGVGYRLKMEHSAGLVSSDAS